ncbi:hypothetical protein V6N13_088988 [Hibiscus sabdariffa]
MAGKAAIMAIFVAVMMLLLAQNNAASSSDDMSSEAPSPQPQPPNNFTMHGITQGSLLPQVQEAMSVLLQQVLRQVLVCAAWHLRKQASLPLLQQLED